MAKKIRTVLGDIAPEEFGFASMHEHILMNGAVFRHQIVDNNPGILAMEHIDPDAKVTIENCAACRRNYFATWDAQDLDDEEAMAGEVEDFKKAGASGLVEMSVPGIRRDVAGVKRIAEKVGFNIVVCTGFYIQDSWQPELFELDQKGFYNRMADEIENGIEGTGIKPGHLKIGMCKFSEHEEAALRAAARLAVETGMSLTVHPTFGSGHGPLRICRICKEEGMDTTRLTIAHIGGFVGGGDLASLIRNPVPSFSLDTLQRVVDHGANLSLEFANPSEGELFGMVNTGDYMKLASVVKMVDRGYAEQIVMATDTCAKPMARRYGGEGYCRLTNFAIPALKRFGGLNDEIIDTIMVKNPARILAY